MITNREELKQMFHEAKQFVTIQTTGKGKGLDSIIVEVYQHMAVKYDEFTKDDAKQVALCLVNNYGFLYK